MNSIKIELERISKEISSLDTRLWVKYDEGYDVLSLMSLLGDAKKKIIEAIPLLSTIVNRRGPPLSQDIN